jgi:hypothetical protein
VTLRKIEQAQSRPCGHSCQLKIREVTLWWIAARHRPVIPRPRGFRQTTFRSVSESDVSGRFVRMNLLACVFSQVSIFVQGGFEFHG